MEEEEKDVQEEVVQPQEEEGEAEAKPEAKTVPYERLSKEIAKRKELEEKLAALQPKEEKPDLQTQEKPLQFDELVDTWSAVNGLKEDELTELRATAKNLGTDPVKLAQSDLWKNQLQALRAKQQSEDKTPTPSKRVATYNGRTFAEAITSDEVSDDEKQKAYRAHVDKLLNKGTNEMI
jgi:hypothetical protein